MVKRFRKLGLSAAALMAGVVLLAAPHKADAKVHFGVTLGAPVYSAPVAPYGYDYPVPDPYAYPAPAYAYPAPAYVAPAHYYSYGWNSYGWNGHDGHEWREHERHEQHEWREHHDHDGYRGRR